MSRSFSSQKSNTETPALSESYLPNKRHKRKTKLSEVFGDTSLRIYGAFFLTFGALTIFLHLFRFLIDDQTHENDILNPLIVGFVLVAVSVPLFISDKPLWKIVLDSPFFRFLSFDYFCLPHSSLHTTRGIPLLLSMAFGILFSLFGYFVTPVIAAMSLLGLFIFFCAISAPEMPFFLSILLLPALSLFPNGTHVLCALILICLFAYLRKLLTGRRKASVRFYDVGFFLFGIFTLFSSVFSSNRQSLILSIMLLCFLLSFPLIRNLLTNRRLLSCSFGSFVVGSLSVSVLTLVRAVLPLTSVDFPAHPFFATLADGIMNIAPRHFSVFLLCSFFSSFYFLAEKTSRFFSVCNIASMVLSLFALAVSQDYFALIGLVAALLCIVIYRNVRRPLPLLFLVFLFPLALVFVPCQIPFLAPYAEKTVFGTDVLSLPSLLPLLRENLFFGFGMESESARIAFSGIADSVFFDSLYLPLILNAGVLASALFFLTLLFRPIQIRLYDVRYGFKNRDFGCLIGSCAAFAVLVTGVFAFPFSSVCMFYPFLIVFALGSVSLSIISDEIGNREEAARFQSAADEATADVRIDKRFGN